MNLNESQIGKFPTQSVSSFCSIRHTVKPVRENKSLFNKKHLFKQCVCVRVGGGRTHSYVFEL